MRPFGGAFPVSGAGTGDRGKNDWRDLLGEEDYRRLGEIARDYAVEHCQGRRYALLEGGYNHQVLGRHVLAFLEGFG